MPRLGDRHLALAALALVAGVIVVVIWVPSVIAWAAGIAAAVATAYLSQELPDWKRRRTEQQQLESSEPVMVTATVVDQDYVTLTHGGETVDVAASGHTVRVVVTGAWPMPVILTTLRPEVLAREDRSGDLARHAAEISPRRFEVLLDAVPPRIRPLASTDFPYELKRGESEVLDLLVTTDAGDVRWVLWLEWSANGQTGNVRIDLGGHEFRTAARHPSPP